MTMPLGWQELPLNRIIRMRSGDFISNDDIEAERAYPVYGGNGFRGFTDQFNAVGPIVLVGRQDAHCGNVHVADGQIWVSEHALRCFPEKELDAKWLAYALRDMNLNQYSVSAAQPGLSVDNLKHLRTAVPPLDTQKRIARFLDEKTARIDGLIDNKRALLDQLTEKRQTLITRAVTKGLNAQTPMKPSGIDWLGEIPAHWEVLPLKRVVRYQEGPGILAIDFRNEGVPLLRVASIGNRYATLDGVNYLDPAMAHGKWGHFLTEVGDLLISASATSGIVSEVTEETSECVPYTGIIRVNPIDGVAASAFVRHLLVSDVFLSQIDQLKAGSTIQHFGPYHLGLMVITKPPLCEQRAIGLELDQTLGDLEQNEARVGLSIQLLSEYRSAIITAAVTGQHMELR